MESGVSSASACHMRSTCGTAHAHTTQHAHTARACTQHALWGARPTRLSRPVNIFSLSLSRSRSLSHRLSICGCFSVSRYWELIQEQVLVESYTSGLSVCLACVEDYIWPAFYTRGAALLTVTLICNSRICYTWRGFSEVECVMACGFSSR